MDVDVSESSEVLPSLEDVFAMSESGMADDDPGGSDESPEAPGGSPDGEANAPAGTAPVAETEAPESPPVPAPIQEDPHLALARVAAAEREISERRRQEQDLLDTIEKRTVDLVAREAKAQEWADFIQRIEEGDPLAALESRGISLDALTEGVATGRGIRPNKRLEEQVAQTQRQLREYQEAQARAQQEAQVAQQWHAVTVATEREVQARSPLLASMGQEGVALVLQVAQEEQARGVQPTYEASIAGAEARLHAVLERAMAVEQVRSRYASTPTTSDATSSPKQAATRTVSNAAAGTPAAVAEKPDLYEMDPEAQFDFLKRQGLFAG